MSSLPFQVILQDRPEGDLRSTLAQTVRKQFGARLLMEAPPFREIPADPKGNRLYQWQVAPDYWVYVLLHLHHLGDNFVVEVAWTKGQPFPGGYSRPTGEPWKDFERFRLYELWNEREPLDLWWIGGRPRLDPTTGSTPQPRPEGELLAEAEGVADEAVDRLMSFAMPYLSRVAKGLGHELAPIRSVEG